MIKAIIFDLDGVLVQTEKLKGLAYALAVQRILGLPKPDFQATKAYMEVIGASRAVTSKHVVDKLKLASKLRPFMAKYGVSRPEDALTAIRYEIYDKMVENPQVFRDNEWPFTVEVLKIAKENFCKIGLATLSRRPEVLRVTDALGITNMLDAIVTAEDVVKGKPDPEIYLTTARKLGVPPKDCLILEDTVNGVKSALAAGAKVIAIANPYTKASLLKSKVIDGRWIVKDPGKVGEVIRQRIKESECEG